MDEVMSNAYGKA